MTECEAPDPDTALSLHLENRGNYLIRVTAAFTVDGERQHRKLEVFPYQKAAIDDIDQAATDLEVQLRFMGDRTRYLAEAEPVQAWPDGCGHIRLDGHWQGPSSAQWVQAD